MSKNFKSAMIKRDGTVEVRGPFTLNPGEPKSPALVSFYLVQKSGVVDGEPTYTTVGGEGHWSVGAKEWVGTCSGELLKVGDARGYGMAILVQAEPPGFATWTWSSSLKVTGADTSS